jgi:hypothetical protein
MHRDSVLEKGLDRLWNKKVALDPKNVAGFLYTTPVLNFIKRQLSKKYRNTFTDEEVENSINRVVSEEIPVEEIKHFRVKKIKRKTYLNDASRGNHEIKSAATISTKPSIEQSNKIL